MCGVGVPGSGRLHKELACVPLFVPYAPPSPQRSFCRRRHPARVLRAACCVLRAACCVLRAALPHPHPQPHPVPVPVPETWRSCVPPPPSSKKRDRRASAALYATRVTGLAVKKMSRMGTARRPPDPCPTPSPPRSTPTPFMWPPPPRRPRSTPTSCTSLGVWGPTLPPRPCRAWWWPGGWTSRGG